MRRQLVISAFLFLALSGCQLDDEGFHQDELGSTQQASVGGVVSAPLPHHDAVAAITVLLPLVEGQDPDLIDRDVFQYCTGVLIEERVVLTAADCLDRNHEASLDADIEGEFLDAASVWVQFGSTLSGSTKYTLDATFDAGIAHKGIMMHRYYDDAQPGNNDFVMLRLSESPSITPAVINEEALAEAMVGEGLELVGYGKSDADGSPEEFTDRQAIAPVIESISATRVSAGTSELTSCHADSGGPGFYDFGDGYELVTISEKHRQCEAGTRRQRVDVHTETFIMPFLRFVSGDCAADAACGDCDLNGVCKEDCATRDWDCELGSFAGEVCNQDGDCEEGGHCIAATDDSSFTYCAKPCVPEDKTACPSGMTCSSNECIYEGVSPGSQGATCSTPSNCRSGFCENLLCANECNPDDEASCDAEAGFFCLTSEANGATATVCRTSPQTGGGGFCAISPAGSGTDGSRGLLAGFGLLCLLGVFVRRRS